ncbi:MAG: 3-hydroxyacyl-CoA dehydrogenase [Rhodocyclaceae bacterium]|nr:MAG: 3-hydroxyacyl-CoA dehydrogenase [Rhodocyclaceae bacterium]
MNNTHYEVDGGIALIRLDNPPVNGLSLALRSGIVSDVKRAEADAKVQAIILIGSDKAFSGGADIREFGTPAVSAEPTLHTVINLLETSTKPVIAAIGGTCMGGGLELALGCHFRVAVAGAQIALPEVKLGLLPGGGGTQRLPRLIGIEAALNMIVSGETVSSDLLRATPLFDHFIEGDLLAGAIAFAKQAVAEKRPLKRVRDLQVTHPKPAAFFMFVRNSVGAISKNYPAPLKCVDAVEGALTKPFDEGLKAEGKLFMDLYVGDESRALRHLFLSERKASKVEGVAESLKPRTIASVGIVGAGTMGAGIAINFLLAGVPTVILETRQEALDRGVKHVNDFFEGRVIKGRMKADKAQAQAALLKPTLSYDDFADVDLVIEAVFEEMSVKKAVFEILDRVCKPGAILASNTSTLDLNKIAEFTKRPQDVVGAHFFSPANVMKLLEVIRGARTADEVLLTIMQVAKKIKKTAVISGVCDGFIGNRMIAGYSTEAIKMLEEGASVQQIDGALEKFGMAMGPFRMGDLAGNDIGWAIRKRLRAERPTAAWPTALQIPDQLCEQGRFGQKTGSGWYRYQKGGRAALPDPAVDALVEAHRKANGINPRKIGGTEIVQRCIFALVNEGARILEEGIAQRASDIDIVYIFGYGFPPYRGGPMLYADGLGLMAVERAMQGFARNEKPGMNFWKAAPLLSKLAAEGKTFN